MSEGAATTSTSELSMSGYRPRPVAPALEHVPQLRQAPSAPCRRPARPDAAAAWRVSSLPLWLRMMVTHVDAAADA